MKKGPLLLLLAFVLALLPVNALATYVENWPDGFIVGDDPKAFFRIDGAGVRAVAVQPWDGKIIIGGDFSITTGTPQKTWRNLARINTDGSLDQSFTATPDGAVHAIAIVKEADAPAQQDYQPIPQLNESRIYIGGSFSHVAASMNPLEAQQERHGIARLRCGDGSLDAFAPLAAGAVVNALVADPDGKSILAGGVFSGTVATPSGTVSYRNIARISITAPDDESVTGTFSGGTDGEVNAIVLQEALVVVGGKASSAGKYLARFGADGTPDGAFAAVTDGAVRSLAVAADGKILLGGEFSSVNATPRSYLARLRVDGAVDAAFDPLLDYPGPGAGNFVAAIAVQADGRIVAGGKFTKSGDAVRSHALRLKTDGSIDKTIDPSTDAAVSALAMEPNARFLMTGDFAAAGGRNRSRIARFYCNGALDDFAPNPTENEEIMYWLSASSRTLGVRPDGSLSISGDGGFGMHRLKPDWSLDLSVENYWTLGRGGGGPWYHAQIADDDSIVAVGTFTSLVDLDNPGVVYPAYGAMRYDSNLQPVPDFPHYFQDLYTSVPIFDMVFGEGPWAVAALPPQPAGSALENGMVYIGGKWEPTAAGKPAQIYLVRLKRNGDLDTSFNAPAIDGYVTAIAIQPDGKILVAGLFPESEGYFGGIKRLETNGDLDPTFKAPEFRAAPVGEKLAEMDVIHIAKDGRSMVVGGFFMQLKDQDGTYDRSTLVRLNKTERIENGQVVEERWVVDPVFNKDNFYENHAYTVGGIMKMAPQTDGDAYAMGFFDTLHPAGGGEFVQIDTVKVGHDGRIYNDPVPMQGDVVLDTSLPSTMVQQPDGKLIFMEIVSGGMFGSLRRFSNGWATEELTVSPDGDFVSWMRAGTSPEAWGVYFEEAASESGPWSYLGPGRSIPGGWRLDFDGVSVPNLPKLQNRYIRARAYLEGHNWEPTVSLIESVRQYYLKHPLQVNAADSGKVYGAPDSSLTYSATGFLPGDGKNNLAGNLSRGAGTKVGSYPITQGTLSGGDKYRIIYSGANFAITPATLTVVAKPGSKTTVQSDPAFDFTATGFQNGDSKETVLSGALGREPSGDTAGEYQVNQGTLSAAPNYTIAFTAAPFYITEGVRAPQTITFNGRSYWTYGDADFTLEATVNSPLTVSYASSNPAVLEVNGSTVKVVAAGTAVITASQEGNFAYLPADPVSRTFRVALPPGKCLNFDGTDDYVRIENAPQLNFGGQPGFTVEMWLGPMAAQPNGTILVTKKDGGSPPTGYQLGIDGNRLSALIGDGSSAVTLTATSPVNDLFAHHVALSVDRSAGVGRLYFDGRLEAELADPRFKVNPDNAEPVLLARDRDGTHFYHGDIDELRFWSVARTRDQIRAWASNIIDPAAEPDLAAYYHFDEGGLENPNKTFAPDRTLRGAQGELHNFALVGAASNWVQSYSFTPLLETLPPTSATATSVTGKALLYPNYYETLDQAICIGDAANPALLTQGQGNGGTIQCAYPEDWNQNPFSSLLENLVSGSTYHIQAYADNPMGMAFGNDILLAPKQDQVITFSDIGKVYGAPAFIPTATSTGPGPITYTSSNQAVAKVVGGTIQIVGAGTSTITASQAADETHNAAADVPVTLTVDPATLSIAANAKVKIYGAPEPVLDYATPTGFVYDDNATTVPISGNLVRVAGGNVGSYAIGKGTLSAGPNYTISFTGADLVIDPATMRVTANAKTKIYGGPEPAYDYLVPPGDFVNGDNETVLSGNLMRVAGEHVGNYAIGKGSLTAGGNYTISYTPADLTITPATLTVSAKAKSKAYGAADPALDWDTPPGGLTNGDKADVLNGNLHRSPGEGVGSYAIDQGTLSAGGNYTLSFTGASLTINPAALTVTANAKAKCYGAADPELDYQVQGLVNNEERSAVFSGSLSRASGEKTGSYPIGKGTLSAGGNYTISFTGAELAINPATLTVTANAKSKAYGAADPVLDYQVQGLVNGDDRAAVLSGSLTRSAGENAGSYAIGKGSLSATADYTISFTGANLTINPAGLTVTANGKSKLYGGADPALDYQVQGLVNNENAAAVLTGSLSRAAGESVGSYAIGKGSLSSNANYLMTFTGAKLTINPATLTVSANAKSKSYGTADPPLDYPTPTGFVNGEGISVLTGSLSRAPGEGAGNYAIDKGTLSAGANYTIAFTGANLTINPANLTVTANAKTKTYGAADPALDYAIAGLANGDTTAVLTGKLTRAPGETAGKYAIEMGTLSAGGNYNMTFVGAELTITPATLTVTANAKTKELGTADPVLDFTVTGLLNGDTRGILTGTLRRDAGETAGAYPINLGTLSAGANYTIAFTGASLTIVRASGPAPQVITFDPMRPKTFGDGDFDPGATASSGLPVSYSSSATETAAVVAGRIRVLAPGSTEITASQAGNDYYLPAADVTRTLIVNPPPWNGLGFDGIDDVLRIPSGAELNFGGKQGYTIETWLHLDGSQPDGTGLVSKAGSGSAWSGYQLSFSQDRIAAQIGDGSRTLQITGTSSLNDGQWHHVALSVERVTGSASLYFDGRLEAQVTDPVLKGSPDNTASLLAGVDRNGSRFFKGEMDELRLWDTPRSREEIRSAVSQIIDPLNEQHLVAYFHLDEGDVGQDNALFRVAPERTAYGANGVLQGFALSGSDSNWIRSGAFLPLLETAPLTLTNGGATGGGLVYANYYQATDAGLCWGTSPGPSLADRCVHAGSGPGAFTAAITDLLPATTYHVRAFAVNAMGTAYGNELILETGKVAQSITPMNIPDKTYGDPPFLPGATSTGPLPITYTSSDPSVAIIVNGEIRITGVGTTTITASQGGDQTYSAAADVSAPFTVHQAPLTVTADWKSRAYQTPNPPLTVSYRGFVYGETLAVISGSPVLSTTALPSSPVGEYPITVGLGSLFSRNYSFTLVDGVLSVLKSCQEIVFPPIQERTYGDPPIQIVATACSGLGIDFTSSNGQVAQVNGNILTVTGAGTVVITASQSGSDSVGGAPDVSQTVIVHKAGQALTFPVLPQKILGDAPFDPGAKASSGLPVSYQSSDTTVAVTSGNLVTIVGAGTTVITAIQQGDANYNPAIAASQPLNVAIEGTPPVIDLSALSSGSVTADPVLNVTGSARDASGIATLTVNGVDFTGQENLFSSAVLLTGGQNSVEVIARDHAGNRSTRTVSVTFDAAAPAITASAPADNSVTGSALFSINGTVTPGSAVSMSVNGAPPQSLAVTGGEYSGSGNLQEGINTLEVSAALYGRVSRIKRTVTLSQGKPAVAITEPVEDVRTEQGRVMLRGTVAVPAGEATVVLEVNGTRMTPVLQAGAFQQEVVLSAPGTTRITATVADFSGNSAFCQRNIVRVTPLFGDLNGDALVDIQDVMQALRISTGLETATPAALAHGDLAPLIDGVPRPDGTIDVGDVMVLLRKVLGLVDL